jgi:hypothetical protein
MKNLALRLLVAASLGLLLSGCGQSPPPTAEPASEPAAAEAPALPRSASPDGASLTILSPEGGDVVSSPVTVQFDLQGMTLAPAGDATPNTGHHHLLVDVPAPDLGQVIPKDAQHLHFGQGQATAEIILAPGQHTLQLLLGDGNHVPHNPPVLSPPITITVQSIP